MHILYTLNDKFVPQVTAGICSICENNKGEKINFHIISAGITEKNQSEMQKLAKKYNNELFIYEIKPLEEYLDFEFDTKGRNSVILARLLIDKILPSNIDKLLYLDGDTIVRGSLKNLFKIDMGDKIIGMSIEPTTDKIRKDNLGLHDYPYFNSGVLFIDFKKWRDKKIGDRIIDFYRENRYSCFAPDQDAINVSMKDEIYILPPKYNFYNIFWQYPYWFMKKLMGKVPYFSKKEYMESVKNPVIIHYLGEERPWRAGNHHKYKDDYKKYLSMTYRKDTPDERGWRGYFVCWYIFNFIMKPFPSLRYKIINYLIPKFMDYRKRQLKKN